MGMLIGAWGRQSQRKHADEAEPHRGGAGVPATLALDDARFAPPLTQTVSSSVRYGLRCTRNPNARGGSPCNKVITLCEMLGHGLNHTKVRRTDVTHTHDAVARSVGLGPCDGSVKLTVKIRRGPSPRGPSGCLLCERVAGRGRDPRAGRLRLRKFEQLNTTCPLPAWPLRRWCLVEAAVDTAAPARRNAYRYHTI